MLRWIQINEKFALFLAGKGIVLKRRRGEVKRWWAWDTMGHLMDMSLLHHNHRVAWAV